MSAACGLFASTTTMSASIQNSPGERDLVERRVAALLQEMTLAEKLGQMSQRNGSDGYVPETLAAGLRAGSIGSVLNVVDVDVVNELQRIAVEESRLGIPLSPVLLK